MSAKSEAIRPPAITPWLVGIPVATAVWLIVYSYLTEFADAVVSLLQLSRDTHFGEAVHFDAGADIEEISACASSEGLHALAGALFGLIEEGGLQSAGGQADASSTPVLEGLGNRIREFRKQLPNGSKTAAKIDQSAPLEEISECAEEEGLFSFAAMLAEAEQETLGRP